MSYVGNVPTTAAFPFDQFSGNGSTTAFTLSYAPAGSTSIIVSISGVVQNPNTYSVSGTTITFSPAPPSGTSNIAVLYLGLPVVASMTGTMEFIAGSATNPPIYPTGDTNTGIYFPAADTIAFTEGGTEVMRINSSGNVGVGTSSPSAPLDVARGSGVASYTSYRGNGNASAAEFFVGQGGNNYGYIYNRANGPIEFGTNNTAQALITAAGLFQFNSGYGSVATAYGCRAWVNFNGTGTVAITASGNVSSITDNGTGDYTVNFTNAMPDGNYAWFGMAKNVDGAANFNYPSVGSRSTAVPATGSIRIGTAFQQGAAAADFAYVYVSIFR